MRAYFTQFGTVTRLRLSRNKKTGHSKHYAFIEFSDEEVAKIVAETMNNYLLFGHILKCAIVPRDNIEHVENLFKGANKRFKARPAAKIAKAALEAKKTEEKWTKKIDAENRKRKKINQRLKNKGIEYEFEAPEAKKADPTPEVPAIEAAEEEKVEEPKAVEAAKPAKGKKGKKAAAVEAAPAPEPVVEAAIEEKEEVAEKPAKKGKKAAAAKETPAIVEKSVSRKLKGSKISTEDLETLVAAPADDEPAAAAEEPEVDSEVEVPVVEKKTKGKKAPAKKAAPKEKAAPAEKKEKPAPKEKKAAPKKKAGKA
jgi:nucleolar protein 15